MPKKSSRSNASHSNKGIAWLYREVCALLDIWSEHDIQQQLSGRLHNMCVYEKISQRLRALGIERSAEQCREKIKKLKRDYKTVTDNNYSPAFARKILGCYDKVNEVFGKSAVVKPSSVVESLVFNAKTNTSNQLTEDHDRNTLPSEENAFKQNSMDASEDSDRDQNSSDDSEPSSNPHNIWPEMTDRAEAIAFKEGQKEFFNKFMEIEQKRLVHELEREKQRLKLREKHRQQQQQREFKLFRSFLTIIASQRTKYGSHFHENNNNHPH